MTALTAFDPAHTGPVAVLSSGNRVCAPTDAQNCSRVTNGYNVAGGLDLYLEFLCISTSSFGNNFPGVGISPITDAFTGNGLNGVAATMQGGYMVYDNAVGTFVQAHGGATGGIAHVGNFGGSPVGSAIGCIWRTGLGNFEIYTINIAHTTRDLVCTLAGMPLAGIWLPAYGTGGGAPVAESYQLNTANSQFGMAKPPGTVAYEDAVNPQHSGQLLSAF